MNMEYLVVGLLLFTIGNLIHLERDTATLKRDIKYLKDRLCGQNKTGGKRRG